MRLALDAHAARATLLRVRKLLDSSLGMADFIAPKRKDGFQIVCRPVAARGEPSFFASSAIPRLQDEQGTLLSSQGPMFNPCLRNELSPLSQEGKN
jgi:hypothetical protein